MDRVGFERYQARPSVIVRCFLVSGVAAAHMLRFLGRNASIKGSFRLLWATLRAVGEINVTACYHKHRSEPSCYTEDLAHAEPQTNSLTSLSDENALEPACIDIVHREPN